MSNIFYIPFLWPSDWGHAVKLRIYVFLGIISLMNTGFLRYKGFSGFSNEPMGTDSIISLGAL